MGFIFWYENKSQDTYTSYQVTGAPMLSIYVEYRIAYVGHWVTGASMLGTYVEYRIAYTGHWVIGAPMLGTYTGQFIQRQ